MVQLNSLSLVTTSFTKARNKVARIIWNVFYHIVWIGNFYPMEIRMCSFDNIEETSVVVRFTLRLVVGMLYDAFNVDDLKEYSTITVLKGREGIAIKCTHFVFQIIQYLIGDAVSSGNGQLICYESGTSLS